MGTEVNQVDSNACGQNAALNCDSTCTAPHREPLAHDLAPERLRHAHAALVCQELLDGREQQLVAAE
jgi:hypothetical protein